MHQRVERTDGTRTHAESRPTGSESPDHGRGATLAALALFGLCCAAVGTAEPVWGRAVLVSRPDQEQGVVQATFNQVTGRGVESKYAVAAIAGVDHYVRRRVSTGRTVVLSHGLMADTITAAYEARWPVDEATRLLLTLQADMDAEPRPGVAHFQQAIGRVRAGGTVEEALGAAHPAAGKKAAR